MHSRARANRGLSSDSRMDANYAERDYLGDLRAIFS